MYAEYSPEFRRLFKRLPRRLQLLAIEKEKLFCKNPWHKSLRTHKLKGVLDEYWSFSISYRYRIVFSFELDKTVRFYSIGGHNIYKQ